MVTILPAESCIFRLDSRYGFSKAANIPLTYTDVTLNDMGFGFNDTSSKIVVSSTARPKSIKSVELRVYLATTTEYIIDLASGIRVWANAGTVTATGFTSPTIYVNGAVTSTVAANTWYDIVITTATAINANAIVVGYANSSYLNGYVKLVSLYDVVLTAQETTDRYNRYTFGGKL